MGLARRENKNHVGERWVSMRKKVDRVMWTECDKKKADILWKISLSYLKKSLVKFAGLPLSFFGG